ncbi:SDR family oxidoreductase [Nocardia beijingensis]|uniref:SDR family NAD(P)-dependent oxidoreductase n=1 Tax=Nocardia beijingensis TaxID=95162 RepID=UPI0018937345|nr:SDR family oxidoreductase [Nocardia beijingensis]MBF6465482.1 SDR family oxidoreductase [Nocardia beijingensis]
MSKTIAIFGYGPGLGVGTGRRFGREGFRVAVIGRDPEKARRHADELAAEGIEAAAFPADVTIAAQVTGVITEIEATLGPIEAAMHGAAGNMSDRLPSTLAVDIPSLDAPIALKLHSPILVTRALAPKMVERGDGALLFSSGSSERFVAPYLANFGIALAAQRGYLRQLEMELRGTGVYVGLLNIGALIEGSKAAQIVDEHPEVVPDGLEIVRVSGDELGEHYWRLYTKRDKVELDVGFPA